MKAPKCCCTALRCEANMFDCWERMPFVKSVATQGFSIRFGILALALVLCATASSAAQEQPNSAATWKFAVSGDSRNCGDIVMPAIACLLYTSDAADDL